MRDTRHASVLSVPRPPSQGEAAGAGAPRSVGAQTAHQGSIQCPLPRARPRPGPLATHKANYKQQQQNSVGRSLCLPRFLCLSRASSLLSRSAAFPRPVPAPRGSETVSAPGWGTSKPGSIPDPGSAAPPALCPRRGGSCHRLDHDARLPAAVNPEALPGLERSSFREATASAVKPAAPHLYLSARAPELDCRRGEPPPRGDYGHQLVERGAPPAHAPPWRGQGPNL